MTRTVLVTRHPRDCRRLEELLRPCGISVRAFPVLRVEETSDESGWSAVLAAVPAGAEAGGEAAWILLASPRAAGRLVRQAGERRAEHLLGLPSAAVGTATERAAREAGLDVGLVGPGTGRGLAEALLARLEHPTTLVFACGHDRRPELPEALEAAGHRVLPLELYRMRPTPPRELPPLPPSLDAVVLTSPRSARLYLEGVGGHPLPCPHWALGPTTRDAAAASGIACSIPERPDLESLAEELCKS